MAEAPDEVDVAAARDLRGRAREIWVRRGLACLVAAIPILGLLDVFGQRASDETTRSPVVALTVHAPSHVRAGLLFEARFTIQPQERLADAVLQLSPGWADGLTINTIEPTPADETSANGWLSFDLGAVQAGGTFEVHLQYQVNPTTAGGRDLDVKLLNRHTQLAEQSRRLWVYP